MQLHRPRPVARRFALAGAFLALLSLVPIQAAASTWPGVAVPTQSLGNRGTDVQAIQLLLRGRRFGAPVDGVFGASTRSALLAFEKSVGLTADGVVDRTTWTALLPPRLVAGDQGDAVRALQLELHRKFRSSVVIDGVFSSATKSAVLAFQRHVRLAATGTVSFGTWRYLLWHFELARFNGTRLCDYSVGNGAANWGTSAAVAQIAAAAAREYALGYGRVAVGDISLEHGGNIPLHQTHERGLDVDVRPMRKANDQCRWGTRWSWWTYDRTATRALIRQIRATAPGHVKLIYFNDPVLIREGLTTWYAGHDDHLHVRYCEKTHASSLYDC